MKQIAAYLKANIITIIGIVVGAVGGFLYWRFVGCSSGSCPISGNPYISTFYGALLGGLLFSMFRPKKKSSDED